MPGLRSQADPWGLRAKPAPVRSAPPTGAPQRLVPSYQASAHLLRPGTHEGAPAVGARPPPATRRGQALNAGQTRKQPRPTAARRPVRLLPGLSGGRGSSPRAARPATRSPEAPASGRRPALGAHRALRPGPASRQFSLSLS